MKRFLSTIFSIAVFMTIIGAPLAGHADEIDDETLRQIKLILNITNVSDSALRSILDVQLAPDLIPGTTVVQAALDGMRLGCILDNISRGEYKNALGETLIWAVNRYLWSAIGLPFISTGIAAVEIGVGIGVLFVESLNDAVIKKRIDKYLEFKYQGESDEYAWFMTENWQGGHTWGWPTIPGATTEERIEAVRKLAEQTWLLNIDSSSVRSDLRELGQKIVELANTHASISVNHASGTVPLTVDFNASDSRPGEGQTIQSYDWNFGDGNSSSGVTTSHTFDTPGSYTVTLSVTDSANSTDFATKKIYVDSPVRAIFDIDPDRGCSPITITFDATDSYDEYGEITNYSWDFGDGNTLSGADKKIVSHEYTEDEFIDAKLTVNGSSGYSDISKKAINIGPAGPT